MSEPASAPGPPGGKPAGDGPSDGGPSPLGYLVGLAMIVAIVGGLYLAFTSGGGDGDGDGGPAHIATSTGNSNGVAPDERTGTVPPPESTTDLTAAADAAGCIVREELPEEGRDHLTRDDPVPDYGTVPPTSGDHIGPPLQQADGAYIEPTAPEDVVHSLEHGRVAIQYDPGLPQKDQLALKGLYDTAYSGALLYPNPDMDYAVAAAAWRSLIGCRRYAGAATLDAIRAFGRAHYARAPEDINVFKPLAGPGFGDSTDQ